MATVIGWDVGGANVKATRIDDAIRDPGAPRVVSLPFEIRHARERLPQVLQAALARLAGGFPDAMALTMTAELSDVFATKREGVTFVLDSFESAFPGCPAYTLSLSGEFSPLAEGVFPSAGLRRCQLAGQRAVGRSRLPRLPAPRRGKHDHRHHTYPGRTGGRRGPDGPGPAAGRRAGLYRHVAHPSGSHRAGRAGKWPDVPRLIGVLCDQRRRASRARGAGAGRLHLPDPRWAPCHGSGGAPPAGTPGLCRCRTAWRHPDRRDRRLCPRQQIGADRPGLAPGAFTAGQAPGFPDHRRGDGRQPGRGGGQAPGVCPIRRRGARRDPAVAAAAPSWAAARLLAEQLEARR